MPTALTTKSARDANKEFSCAKRKIRRSKHAPKNSFRDFTAFMRVAQITSRAANAISKARRALNRTDQRPNGFGYRSRHREVAGLFAEHSKAGGILGRRTHG